MLNELLLSDNFDVVPYGVIHNDYEHFMTTAEDGSFSFSPQFTTTIEKMVKRNATKHIFGSSEYARSNGCSPLKLMLKSATDKSSIVTWELHIIITYRRLHDKLPSIWNQRFKIHRNENGIPAGAHKKWPDEGGGRIIPLDEIVATRNFIQRFADQQRKVYNSWKSCADSVTVVNYHENRVLEQNGTLIETDLITNFVCNGIIGANRTCSYLRKEIQGKETHDNSSVDLGPEILAVYAHESGIIPNDLTRQV